jgi:hypothetical protein
MNPHHYIAQLTTADGYRRTLCRIYDGELDAWLDAEELQRDGETITVYRRESGGIWAAKKAWASFAWADLDGEEGRRLERVFDDLLADDAAGLQDQLRRAA